MGREGRENLVRQAEDRRPRESKPNKREIKKIARF